MSYKKILLTAYIILLIIVGILYVPVYLEWGPEQKVYHAKYAPLWVLKDTYFQIDGYTPLYKLDIVRLSYEIAILTLIFLAAYLLLSKKGAEK